MSAFKLSARIIVAAAAILVFAASCGQLLGDYVVTVEEALPSLPGPDASVVPEKICEAGTTECDGRVLRLCTDDGTAWATLEVCATPELCESSDVSTVSACIPPECAVEQMSCDDNVLLLCNTARTGWELFATCESAAHCDAGRRQCLPAPCEPGDRRCNVGSLERCNDTRTAWEQLDSCETNELCEATIAPPTTVGEVLSSNQLPFPELESDAQGPTQCRAPICVPREVRCDSTLLIACNEGQTDFATAEECATPKLCEASITYTGLRGSPRCVRPICGPGEHRCTPEGVLEVCNADRDRYDPIEICIGPPFCNAVAADNGGPGCEDAPCDPGEQQCNGPQIQVCANDQTQFVAVGAPCETRGLCNDDNPVAFCQAPVCQRGPFSGTEFRCEGATLLRCNDQHTGYDPINACATPALCNAGLGFAGCQPPACAPGETRCSGNFVQRCNAERTAFVNVEQCAAGTCDSALGRCADPCVPGSARCNAQGNLEECRDLLVGREITARCGSVQLCDASARSCRQPPAGCTADGVRRCRVQGQNSVLEVCTDGRSRFATLDTCTPGEICDPNDTQCDVCQQGSDPVCEGSNLATCAANGQTEGSQPCTFGCQSVATGPDRCRNCTPGSTRCEGRQLVVCRQRNGEEVLDREDCDTAQLCQTTLAACSGENCRCQDSVCDPGERRCNGAQPQVCNDGQTGFIPAGDSCVLEENCNEDTGRCFACAVGDVRCTNGALFGCALDRSGFTIPLGSQRCVSDVSGERSQSCNGSTLVDTRCPNATPECVEGFGCRECDPDPGEFESECDSNASRTICRGGDVVSEPCEGDSGCIDAICTDARGCITSSSPEGTRCTRAGDLPGFCDGLQSTPSCVECVEDAHCNDGNACTTDRCLARGTCEHTPVTCNSDGQFCNGVEMCDPARGCVSVQPPVCEDDDPCTTNSCSNVLGRCDFPALCGAGEQCVAGRCVACTTDAQCADTNECTTDTCTGAGTCSRTPNTGDSCNGGQGVCSAGTCVAACNPANCPFRRCNALGTACDTCVASDCGGGNSASCTTTVCNGGTSCEPATRNGESCGINGTCNGAECVEASGGDPGSGNGGDPDGDGP